MQWRFSMKQLIESEVEYFAISELVQQLYTFIPGLSISPDVDSYPDSGYSFQPSPSYGLPGKRNSYSQVILEDILEDSINRLNSAIPQQYRKDAFKQVLSISSQQLIDTNESFHKLLIEGVPIINQSYDQGREERAMLIDFLDYRNNIYNIVNQFTIHEDNYQKQPDIIIFINGIPLIVLVLKKNESANDKLREAYDTFLDFKTTIPSLFYYNAFCIISDGFEAKIGTISSTFSRFHLWKYIAGFIEPFSCVNQLELIIKGLLDRETLLDVIRNFIGFEKSERINPGTGLKKQKNVKRIASYYQYYKANKTCGRIQIL